MTVTGLLILTPNPASAAPADCAGTTPLVCHFDVAPGNYDVSVRFGAGGTAGPTAVLAEARRVMLGPAGAFTVRTFRVNVREPEGEPTKTGVGTLGLTLTFTGAAPSVRQVSVRRAVPVRPVLYLAGDSTVCDQDTAPYTGWGQVIPQYLPAGVTVANYADSGEGSASFLADPLLFDTMRPLLRRGDVVLIQFGHNDKQTTAADYRANLARMIAGVRAQQARPVLVSPPVRRRFDTDGHLDAVAKHVNGLGVDLPAEMAGVAGEQGVPYIDLTGDSAALVEGLGPEAAKRIYLYNEAGDNTHFSEYGADQIGRLVLTRLNDLHMLPGPITRGGPATPSTASGPPRGRGPTA